MKWHHSSGKVEMAIFLYASRLPRERPYPELRNEPPLDSLEKPVPNPLMASLWIGSGAGWPLKGLGLASPNYQVGAHFEALDKGVLVAASKSIETFFAISTFPELRCR